jgi:hypothetical protein
MGSKRPLQLLDLEAAEMRGGIRHQDTGEVRLRAPLGLALLLAQDS